MTKEEAKKNLVAYMYYAFDDLPEDVGRAIDMAIKALEGKDTNVPTKWIPVSERLPEKNMRCLVACGRFNFTEIATYSDLMGIIDHKIFYQGAVGHDDFVDITQYVKAWMPLTKPYKGEEHDR